MTTYTKEDRLVALADLADYDHCFISPEGVRKICRPFGFEGHVIKVKTNPQDFKGLTGANGETELEGADAADVAEDICRKLDVPYPQLFGRGARLRAAVAAARQKVESET